jgi:uncharacterized RDD family membrane protein YckC
MVCPQCGTLNPDGKETCFRCEHTLIRDRVAAENRCRWHPDALSSANCVVCDAPICDACAIRIEDVAYCRNCAAVPGEERTESEGPRLLSPLEVATIPCAGLGWRFLAGLIDDLILGTAAVILAFAIWLLTGTPPGMPWTGGINGFYWTVLFLGAGAYFVGYQIDSGQTPGYGAVDLLLAHPDGRSVTLPKALLRYLVSLASAAVCMLGYLWILWDRDDQAWHDKAANTLVLRASERKELPQTMPAKES